VRADENCKQNAGTFIPVIDRNRCEGKAECVKVCPVSVFAVGTLPKKQRVDLNLQGKIKGFVHRWQQALLVNPEACQACARCVDACPEDAISLVRVTIEIA
jgi:4Fe-4S ferredoxin